MKTITNDNNKWDTEVFSKVFRTCETKNRNAMTSFRSIKCSVFSFFNALNNIVSN